MGEGVAGRAWARRDAWHGILDCPLEGKGLTISPLKFKPLIHIAINPAEAASFAALVQDIFGVALPSRPCRIVSHGLELTCAGLHQWFLSYQNPKDGEAACRRLETVAALTDLSNSRAILHLSGPKARNLLAKGCSIDLHQRVFGPNYIAQTMIAHMGIHLCQLDDTPTYEVSIWRSLAGSLFAWLSAAAKEFGVEAHRQNSGSSHAATSPNRKQVTFMGPETKPSL
jgi:methylglutamate dehydrogenase subunit D